MSELSPEHWREIASMNAPTYAMSEEGPRAAHLNLPGDHDVIIAAFFNGPHPDGLEITCKQCSDVLLAEREADAFIYLAEVEQLRGEHLRRRAKAGSSQREEGITVMDWREMFGRYMARVIAEESVDFLWEQDWSAEEWAALGELAAEDEGTGQIAELSAARRDRIR